MKYNYEDFRPCSCCNGSGTTKECYYIMLSGISKTIYTGKISTTYTGKNKACGGCNGEVLSVAAFTEWKKK